jgi:hypothetical protein
MELRGLWEFKLHLRLTPGITSTRLRASRRSSSDPTGYYMGAAKVGREAMAGTRFMQMIDRLGGESAWAPVVRRGLGEMAAIAPFEVGRLGYNSTSRK